MDLKRQSIRFQSHLKRNEMRWKRNKVNEQTNGFYAHAIFSSIVLRECKRLLSHWYICAMCLRVEWVFFATTRHLDAWRVREILINILEEEEKERGTKRKKKRCRQHSAAYTWDLMLDFVCLFLFLLFFFQSS